MGNKSKTYNIKGVVVDQSLSDYIENATLEYGTEVIEERAIPDFRDGCKPVHRYILWALYKLGLHHKSGFKKSARTVGEVIGKYSPHSDKGTYDAMVNMVGVMYEDGSKWEYRNCTTPLVEGFGNFGSATSEAASMRYTESRLAKFSDNVLLDPDYLAVIDYVDNFSGDEKVPLILPAKLPVMLMNFSEGIAVGIAASSPGFSTVSVIELTKKALAGEELTDRLLYRTLQIDPPYGGTCISTKADFYAVFKGKGSLTFRPTYTVDQNKRIITLTSLCPGLYSANSVETLLLKLSTLPEVASVSEDTDKTGVRYPITLKRGQDVTKFEQKLLKIITRKQHYDIGITKRSLKGVKFSRASVADILQKWLKWRIELELKVIARLIKLEQDKLDRLNLFVLAVNNLDTIVKALKLKKEKDTIKIEGKSVEVEASAAYLVKNMKITLEQANTLLDMKVRQLRAMELDRLNKQIKIVKAEIKQLEVYQKNPQKRVSDLLPKPAELV